MPKEKAIYKICPMPQIQDCIKEQCAWWEDLAKDCAILVIAKLGSEGSFYALRQEIKAGGSKVTLGELLLGKEKHKKQMKRVKEQERKK